MSVIQSYINACKNEWALDQNALRFLREETWLDVTPPRPFKAKRLFQKKPKLARFLYSCAARIWWWGPFPALLAVELVCAVSWLLKAHRRFAGAVSSPIAALHATPRLPAVLRQSGVAETVQTIITVPWLAPPDTYPDKQIPLSSVIQFRDLIVALVDAWRGGRDYAAHADNVYGRLQTYTAYRWFLVRRVLQRELAGYSELWIANHYDRWAILCDDLAGELKFNLCVIQHGVFMNPPMPVRLKNVQRVACINEESADIFKRTVLEDKCHPSFSIFKSNIKLTHLKAHESSEFSVLIIGQPIDVASEKQLVRHILETFDDVIVYVKPHPIYGEDDYMDLEADRCKIIRDKKLFPYVDVAFCTYSTLGFEYEASGIPVIWVDGKKTEFAISALEDAIYRKQSGEVKNQEKNCSSTKQYHAADSKNSR